MAPRILFSLAHKGGTGRSLASINLAFQLSLRGRGVALLDLDLVGGTLHQICRPVIDKPEVNLATFEKRTNELKSRITLLEYLFDSDRDIRPAAVHSEDLYGKHSTSSLMTIVPRAKKMGLGKLVLFPRSGKSMSIPPSNFGKRLTEFYSYLFNVGIDFIICDMQAGISDTLDRALQADRDGGHSAHWMVFVRATPQHVAGAQDLIEFISARRHAESPTWLIPTAMMPFSDAASSTGSSTKADKLAKFVWDRLGVELKNLGMKYSMEVMRDGLSFEKALQWSEGVLGRDKFADGYFDDVAVLAEKLDP